MKKLLAFAAVVAVVLTIAGCGTRASTRHATDQREPPHNDMVCILRGTLPDTVPVKVLGYIKGSKRSPGKTEEVFTRMADEARKMGATAIVDAKGNQHFNIWVVVRPVGNGTAVKVLDDDFDCLSHGGEFY
ncbi:MAG: hypothetical protein FWF41_04470 [Betaproteobacteria bacterium]|nr:hypothetical protein [Betaproteobacteria bacterium]